MAPSTRRGGIALAEVRQHSLASQRGGMLCGVNIAHGEAMRLLTWNIGHQVGNRKVRLEAADAIGWLDPDLAVITEYFPKGEDTAFKEKLRSAGLSYQVESLDPTGRANRVLIASQQMLTPIDLKPPHLDEYFPASFAACSVTKRRLTVIGVRVPWYDKEALPRAREAWDWIEKKMEGYLDSPTAVLGDFNVSEKSPASRGGDHFRRMLASGWRRATPIGSSYGQETIGNQIDHILYSKPCTCENASQVRFHAAIQS